MAGNEHVALIVQFEGFDPNPYWDHHQWSIGYGSFAGGRDRNQRPNIGPITQAQGRAMMAEQLGRYERNVDSFDRIYHWTPNERAAMISFAYNIGSIDGLTAGGTRSKAEIARMMLQYNKASGQVNRGLTDRRRAEHQVFTGGAPLPPSTDMSNVGLPPTANGTTATGAVEGAGGTGVAAGTNDFAAAGNMADLWSIAEQSGNFWDNELDTFDFYTYDLEFFIVDQQATFDFLSGDVELDNIINDAWPDSGTRRVTIGMTAATTEFNVQDLNVESLGYGAGDNARMSGTATYLSFTIVQVGNTSLADTLQNAALLSGYTSILDATWYMKINFKGHTDNQSKKISATKVLPFKISNFRDMQTSTDARGTSTLLEGTIIQRSTFDTVVNVIENTFTFAIGDNLRDTITNFITSLNENIELHNYTGEQKFINTYSVEIDPMFEEQFMDSKMNNEGITNTSSSTGAVSSRTNGLNISQHSGQLTPGNNIYNTLSEIILQSEKMSEELKASSDTFSSVLNIVPVIVPKPDGLNILTNVRGCNVVYHIGIRRTPIIQSQDDLHIKVQNTAKLVDEIFTKGRCRKRYYYQYTGLNDQILEFQVSLNKQLQKTYVTPTDEFMFARFVNANGTDVRSMLTNNERALTAFDAARAEVDGLTETLSNQQKSLSDAMREVSNMSREIRQTFISDLTSQGVDLGIARRIADDRFTSGQSLNQMVGVLTQSGSSDEDVVRSEQFADRVTSINEAVTNAQNAVNTTQSELSRQQAIQDNVTQQAIGAQLSEQQAEALSAGRRNPVFDSMDTGNDGIILAEEIETDFVTRLNNDEFDSLLHTIKDNPMVFRRIVLGNLLGRTTEGVFKVTDQEGIELARQKYYEGLQVDISMQNLSITIKGDPFWLNNYITPKKAIELFGDASTLEQYRNYTIDLNGQNYCMIIDNKAASTDTDDNIKIANLMVAVYSVKSITNTFSNGLFTQRLEMIKMPFPADFKALNPTIDARVDEGLNGTGGGGTGTSGLGATAPGELGDGLRGGSDGSGLNIEGTTTGDGTGTAQGNATSGGDIGDGLRGGTVLDETPDNGALSGPGRGSVSPSEIASISYRRSRDSLNTFVDTFTGASVPTASEAANLITAMNEMKIAAIYGSEDAKSDLTNTIAAVKNTFGATAEDFAEVINSDPEFFNSLTPEFVAAMSDVYKTDVTELLSDPSAVDTTGIMESIAAMESMPSMSVNQIQSENVENLFTSTPNSQPATPTDVSKLNAMISGDLPTVDSSSYSPPIDYGYSESRRAFTDKVLDAERAYVTASEAAILAKIEQEQISILETTNGSWNALTPQQQQYYNDLVKVGEDMKSAISSDPTRQAIRQNEILSELNGKIETYNELKSVEYDFDPDKREERLSEIDELETDIIVANDSTNNTVATRVIPSEDGTTIVEKIEPTVVPVELESIHISESSSDISGIELKDIPQNMIDEYKSALELRREFMLSLDRADGGIVNVTFYDPILKETWTDQLPRPSRELAEKYGYIFYEEGVVYNYDEVGAVNGYNSMLYKFTEGFDSLTVSNPGKTFNETLDGKPDGGPLRTQIQIDTITINSELIP